MKLYANATLCACVCVCVHYMRINCIRNTQRIDNCDALLSRSCSKPAKVGNAFLSDNARVCVCVCVSVRERVCVCESRNCCCSCYPVPNWLHTRKYVEFQMRHSRSHIQRSQQESARERERKRERAPLCERERV